MMRSVVSSSRAAFARFPRVVFSASWIRSFSNPATASLSDAVSAYEKDLIQDALKTTRGNRAKAARLLDSTERIINYKVKQYGIDAKRFRS